jgi:hypothetical protein
MTPTNKPTKKLLQLTRHTLRSLDDTALSSVAGAGTVISGTKCPGHSTECSKAVPT